MLVFPLSRISSLPLLQSDKAVSGGAKSRGQWADFSSHGVDTVHFGQALTTVESSIGDQRTNPTGWWWQWPWSRTIPNSSRESMWYQQLWKDMTRIHQGQYRRNSAPFFIHPLEVMVVAMTLAKATPTETAAACLHDALEDQRFRYLKVIKRKMIHPDVDRLVQAATQVEIEYLQPQEVQDGMRYRARVGDTIVTVISKDEKSGMEELKSKAKFERRDQYIETVRHFPRDAELASKLVLVGSDKIVGMQTFLKEVRDGMLSQVAPNGEQSPYDKFYLERFKTLEYYQRLAIVLWNKYEQIPSANDKQRLRPLMHELAYTYFDLSQVVHEFMPAHGNPHYVPSDAALKALLEEPMPLRKPEPKLIPQMH